MCHVRSETPLCDMHLEMIHITQLPVIERCTCENEIYVRRIKKLS